MSSPIIAWLINAVPTKVQDLINNHKIRLESFVFFCRRTTLASLTLENVILVTRQRKCFMLIFWHTRPNLNKRTAPRLLPHYFLPMMKIWAISNVQIWPRNSYSLRFLRTFTLNILRGSFWCNEFSCGIDETMITNSNMWNIYVIFIQYVIVVGLICEDQLNSSGCVFGDTRRELINCEYWYRSHSSSNLFEHWLGFPDEISQCYNLPCRIEDSIFSVPILSRIFSKLLNSSNDEPGGLYTRCLLERVWF